MCVCVCVCVFYMSVMICNCVCAVAGYMYGLTVCGVFKIKYQGKENKLPGTNSNISTGNSLPPSAPSSPSPPPPRYVAKIAALSAEVSAPSRSGNEFVVKTADGSHFDGSAAFGDAAIKIAVPTASECGALKDAQRAAKEAKLPRQPDETPPIVLHGSNETVDDWLKGEMDFNMTNSTGDGVSVDGIDGGGGGGGRRLDDNKDKRRLRLDVDRRTLWLLTQAGAHPGEAWRSKRPAGWHFWNGCDIGNSYGSFFYRCHPDHVDPITGYCNYNTRGCKCSPWQFVLVFARTRLSLTHSKLVRCMNGGRDDVRLSLSIYLSLSLSISLSSLSLSDVS